MYVKQVWKNLPDNSTPLSASRLNHLETQFDKAKEYVDGKTPDISGSFLEAVYVRDYTPPLGPGVDVREAIQEAVNEAGGSKPVVFDPGIYGVSSQVVLTEGTTLWGSGSTIAMMEGSGTGFAVTNFSPSDISTSKYNGFSNILVFGMIFDGQGDSITRRVNSLTFNHARNISVVNCRFIRSRGYHALEMNAVDGFVVENCSFEGFYEMPGIVEKEAIQIDCAVTNAIDSGLRDGTMARNGVVNNCRFSGLDSAPAHHIGVGSHSASPGNYYEGVTVSNCTFSGHSVAGVAPFYWRDCLIQNCAIYGPSTPSGVTDYGVRVSNSQSLTIRDSTYRGGAVHGIALLSSSFNTVVGCTIELSREGVSILEGSDNNLISSNFTLKNSWYGVVTSSAKDNLISGNYIFGSGFGNTAASTSSIRLTGAGGTGNSVSGNKVRPHGVSGQPEALAAVSVHANATDSWVYGNDFKGMAGAITGTASQANNRI